MSRANEPVHPYEVVKHYYGGAMENNSVPGITLREHFAAMAMQGLLAGEAGSPDGLWTPETMAAQAVRRADALLAELERKP